jgi:hypothetical protein
MLGVARPTDERGYPIPLPEAMRKRVTSACVLTATAAGSSFPIYAAARGGLVWWSILLTATMSLFPGLVAGLAFARKDREVALPTPVAAGVAAFVVALAAPFVVYGVLLVTWMFTRHYGE